MPKADKLAHLPVSLRGLDRGISAPLVLGLLIDIVKRERETQAARVLAGSGVTWSRTKQRSNASFKRIAKSFGGNVEATWLLVKMYAMRSMLMDLSIGELFQT